MLKYVAGTGNVGDVVNVTPAFFNNKLRPQKAAEKVTDEEVAKEEAENAAQTSARNAAAESLKEQLESDKFELCMKRKAGPDGQLFGGIGVKTLMDGLRTQLPNSLWDAKGVKITGMTDEDGKKLKHDIKHTGSFGATISLTKEISAEVSIAVEAE